MEIEHPSHEHSLILNENYIAREGDVCRACSDQLIFSCKSPVYSCSCSSITDDTSADWASDPEKFIAPFLAGHPSAIIVSCDKFLLHKSCAELPTYIPNPINPKEFLTLCFNYSRHTLRLLLNENLRFYSCNVCCIPIPWRVLQFLFLSSDTDVYVCFECALFQFQQSLEDRKFEHPAHSQHPLTLIQRPSSFKCDACKVDDINKDSSYRCTKCQFWMHKSCGDAPTTFQFPFHHQHPLVLSFSLPRVYHKFLQNCRLCKKVLNRLDWIYHCRYCRFFAHFQCARSSPMSSNLSSGESEKDNSDVLHLPATDESSMNLLSVQLVKEMSTLYNNNIKFGSSTNRIKDGAHDKHHLQLMTINELNNQKDNDKLLLICDGCVNPIQTDDDHPFYGCVPCKYFMLTFCAEFPMTIEHYPYPGTISPAGKFNEKYKFFNCIVCGVPSNGIFFHYGDNDYCHIGCVTLPYEIKHEAHSHKLGQLMSFCFRNCQACGRPERYEFKFWCDHFDFSICVGCITKSRTINHPWDPHPLHLIYDPAMVTDHVHDFNCEFCSEDIDANFWFYHCSHCDLSFHLNTCYQRSRYQEYSNIKFGATDIIIEKLHPHSLTFVLNKKVRSCEKCHEKQLGKPVLECNAPCKAVFCINCAQ